MTRTIRVLCCLHLNNNGEGELELACLRQERYLLAGQPGKRVSRYDAPPGTCSPGPARKPGIPSRIRNKCGSRRNAVAAQSFKDRISQRVISRDFKEPY